MTTIRRSRVKETTYGQRGGMGPNTGKKAVKYRVVLPDGSVHFKHTFRDHGDTAIATAFVPACSGKVYVAVWGQDETVNWEGDFGRLIAERVS